MRPKPASEKDIINLGKVKFRNYLTVGMMRDIEESMPTLKDANEMAKAFSFLMISTFLLDPKLTKEDASNLSVDTIDQLINEIVELMELKEDFQSLDGNLSYIDRFYRAYLLESERLQVLFRSVEDKTALGITSKLTDLSNLGSLSHVAKAAADMMKLTESISWASEITNKDAFSDIRESISKITEPYLSSALIFSDLHTPSLHTTTYTFPVLEPDFFEQEIVENKAEDAMRMRLVEGYDILVRLEQSIREIIETRLSALCGDKWWKQRVPGDVRNNCEVRKKDKEKPDQSSFHPLYYSYIHDYRKIITRSDNWKEAFVGVFDNSTELEACFNWVGGVRDAIAHARPVDDDQYVLFMAAARWIQSHIDKFSNEPSSN